MTSGSFQFESFHSGADGGMGSPVVGSICCGIAGAPPLDTTKLFWASATSSGAVSSTARMHKHSLVFIVVSGVSIPVHPALAQTSPNASKNFSTEGNED